MAADPLTFQTFAHKKWKPSERIRTVRSIRTLRQPALRKHHTEPTNHTA